MDTSPQGGGHVRTQTGRMWLQAKEGRSSGPGAEPGRLWGGAACSVGLCWLPRMLAQTGQLKGRLNGTWQGYLGGSPPPHRVS